MNTGALLGGAGCSTGRAQSWRLPLGLAAALVLTSTGALAQPVGHAGGASDAPAQLTEFPLLRSDPPQQPVGRCPPGGYAPPLYAMFMMNEQLGSSYEVASPCISPELRTAAEAVGMGRNRPLGVKNVLTAMFTAEGTFAGLPGKTTVDLHINYGQPAARLFVRPSSGGQQIKVFNRNLSWDEATEGGAATPAPADLADRQALIRLTPFGALWTLIEAEGHAKVSKRGGRTVISGTSPYDGVQATVTLDKDDRPATAVIKANGQTYEVTFSNYLTKWEPAYLFIFPEKISWKKNGQPYADLTVTEYKTNPYVVFPVPASLRNVASN